MERNRISNYLYREQDGNTIKGVGVYAYIHNGDKYFLTQVIIYEDGIIDCWELVDLDGLEKKVRQGWIVTNLPIGTVITLPFMAPGESATLNRATGDDEVEFVKLVRDELNELQGKPTTRQEWDKAVESWRESKTAGTQQAALEAYERIPKWGLNLHNAYSVLEDGEPEELFAESL
jgi:hypothetical protein